jgi:hypothetical protein
MYKEIKFTSGFGGNKILANLYIFCLDSSILVLAKLT